MVWPPDTPHSLSSSWLVSKVFCRDFSITQRKDIKKIIKIKSHKTQIPEKTQKQLGAGPWSISGADPLRKSSSASGRSLRSGRRGPGSAGPRSCPLGWAQERAAGGKNCVCGHPVGSGDRRQGRPGQWPPRARAAQPCASPPPARTFSR